IEEHVPAGSILRIQFRNGLLQTLETWRIAEFAGLELKAADQVVPNLRIEFFACMKFANAVVFAAELLAKGFGSNVSAGRAENRKVFREQTIASQVVERRDQKALGQVARRAEDEHDARFAWMMTRRIIGHVWILHRRSVSAPMCLCVSNVTNT